MMQVGMNQMKDQAKALLPSEMQDKEEKGDSKISQSNVPKKPKKKPIITRSLAIKMYSFLLFHTLLITILVFLFFKGDSKTNNTSTNTALISLSSNSFSNASNSTIDNSTVPDNKTEPPVSPESSDSNSNTVSKWFLFIVFAVCLGGSVFLSLSISKIKVLSKIYLNYVLYLVLLAANVIGFVCCANISKSLYELVTSMFIIFDAGSFTIILFSILVKETPSTFWLMCSCSGGIIIALVIMLKIYSGSLFRYVVLLFGLLACGIYESMNYNALDSYMQNVKSAPTAPSMISLPFELNVSFLKIFLYMIKGIFSLFSMCCPNKKKKK
jgi:magnesium-transporting ATPase (P-type)